MAIRKKTAAAKKSKKTVKPVVEQNFVTLYFPSSPTADNFTSAFDGTDRIVDGMRVIGLIDWKSAADETHAEVVAENLVDNPSNGTEPVMEVDEDFDLMQWFTDSSGEVEDTRQLTGSNDDVNHPAHYTSHPSGIEAIQLTEHMNFCLGNAMKYLFRAGSKPGVDEATDLKKAIWYINRHLTRVENSDG